MTFELQHTDNASDARTGIITTDHGQIKDSYLYACWYRRFC